MIYECERCFDLFEELGIYEDDIYGETKGCPSCGHGDIVTITEAHPKYHAIYREYIKSRVEAEG